MVRQNPWFLNLFGLLAACSLALSSDLPVLQAQTLVLQKRELREAAQDATGTVWALGSGPQGDTLYRWYRDGWEIVSSPSIVPGAHPITLKRRTDGKVACLWSLADQKSLLTLHEGQSSGLLADLDVRFEDPWMFAGQDNSLWITEKKLRIYRVWADGVAQLMYTIQREQLHPYGRGHELINPIFITADPQGRLWFWSDALAGGSNIGALRGILIFDGKRFQHHAFLSGIPDQKISFVTAKDEHRSWIALLEEGLFEVEIDSLKGRRLAEPENGAFDYVQTIFSAEGDWYVVSGAMWRPVAKPDGQGVYSQVWRLRDGSWEKVISGLDKKVEYRRHPARAWLSRDEGLWLGSFGGGPWLLPAEGNSPIRLDWHYGVPLSSAERLFSVTKRDIMAVSFDQGSVTASLEDWLIPQSKIPPGVETFRSRAAVVQDEGLHLWTIRAASPDALSQWQGERWVEHALPEGIDSEQVAYLAVDSLQRVWLCPNYHRGPAAVFDPQNRQWQVFASYPLALLAQLSRPSGFRLGRDELMVPSFSTDGRICFRDAWDKLLYFDASQWRQWDAKGIAGDSAFNLDGPPFFDEEGRLAVNISGRTWRFSEKNGWQASVFEPDPFDRSKEEARQKARAFSGCRLERFESAAVGADFPIAYLTSNGQLYKVAAGVCISQFSSGWTHPFLDGRQVQKVLMDKKGNTFLGSFLPGNPGFEENVLISAGSSTPDTSLKVDREGADHFRVQLSARGQAPFRYLWRLNDQAWTVLPGEQNTLRLRWLPAGLHRLEVLALDRGLQWDLTPAVETIKVRVDAVKQIRQMISALTSGDSVQREEALQGLLLQPSRALPELERARRTASGSSARWWIDAAIQRIRESKE